MEALNCPLLRYRLPKNCGVKINTEGIKITSNWLF